MATHEHELADAPTQPRARELWLQHAAGFIVFEDVRRYAMERIDPKLTGKARAAVQKGINNTVYGLMMVIDGVSGGLSNAKHKVNLNLTARLETRGEVKRIESEVDLFQGDGMCMGYHGWLEGDFGSDPVVLSAKPMSKKKAPKKKNNK